MHRGFKLTFSWEDEKYYQVGLANFNANKVPITSVINKYAGKNGVLQGTQLQADWFPQIETDVFISHSHRDERIAISLAGWLQKEFGLNVFIDSCIWGYADDLLKLIDNEFCLDNDSRNYDYEKRNRSTAHVNIMLSTALGNMIDKAECLLFLNTPNAIQTKNSLDKTQSPWIFCEISISRIVRKRKLSYYRKEITKAFSTKGRLDESAIVEYEVNLGHLQDLKASDLNDWLKKWKPASLHEEYPLNYLYEAFPADRVI